ncbi:MerC domain-containing protein [Croceivirga thetidis]|uniref:MerC domain-containing protein n=1 Tax=Croceivirga thetidis TaxID=2721623 RepID=A0ABX1GTD9_9FLAO|nr:MerC domain-containing protein [Croceivirga thetidis]NKI32175.1 MerC domain-containing protein [Croceivirga thetidis]
MNILQLTSKSDVIGISASTLCLIHCIATPFLFVAQAELLGGTESHPFWWGLLDIAFLLVSYFAVWWSASNTTKTWVPYALWISWGFLSLIVLNEKFELMRLPEQLIYIPTVCLIIFHLYNRKYHDCSEEQCELDKN